MDRILTPEESIVEILAADCRVHEHRGCSGCKTLATIDDLKDAKECWGGTAKLIANYYETVVIPAKLTEATLELCEKYENDIIPQKIEEVVNEIEELRNHCGCGCKNDNSPECEYRFMSIYCRAYGLWKHSKYYSQESGA
jgi:hypothetical protein